PNDASSLHVGDLDGSSTSLGSNWNATVTARVHDSNEGAVSNATVTGSWSTGGSSECVTSGDGICNVTSPNLRKRIGSTTFTVTDVTHATLTYSPSANHDPDGDSDGTSITVSKP
ncbi:MAG: hypothetical protein WEC79_00475, partial [Thermomicrobiales bacterium]